MIDWALVHDDRILLVVATITENGSSCILAGREFSEFEVLYGTRSSKKLDEFHNVSKCVHGCQL